MRANIWWGIAVALTAVLFTAIVVLRNAQWTPDGFSYARVALQDAGLQSSVALAKAEAFYLQQPVGHNPRYRVYFTVDAEHAPPAPGPIFRTRLLYPWLVSHLYPALGLQALIDVSAAAYVVAAVSVFWLLLAVARAWIAAVGALCFVISPLEVSLAQSDLTDMLAIACWIALLACVLHYMRNGKLITLAAFGCAALLLALTRQALFLPIGALIGAIVGTYLEHDAERQRRSLYLAAIFVVVALGNGALYILLHGAGPKKELEIAYNLAMRGGAWPHPTMQQWYRESVRSSAILEARRAIVTVLPLIAIGALIKELRRGETAILIGAALATLAGVFIHPIIYDLSRIIDAPLLPVLLCAIAMGAESALQTRALSTRAVAKPA